MTKFTFCGQRRMAGTRCLLTAFVLMLALGAQQALAQITRVGQDWASVNGTSVAVNTPAGTATDDVLLAVVTVRGGGQTINLPGGWTAVAGLSSSVGGDMSQRVFHRVATAGEPASHTFSWTVSAQAITAIVSYRNVNTGAPINVSGAQTAASGTSITAPSIGTTAANTMLVGFFGDADARATITAAATMTQVSFAGGPDPSSAGGPNGVITQVAEQAFAGPGATGAKTATSSRSAPNIGHILALRPARTFLVEAAGGGVIGTQITGTSFDIRITARTPGGTTDTAFNGTVTITSTGSLSAGSGVTANFVSGVLATHAVRISNTGTFNVTATETLDIATGVSNDFLVAPRLQILVPGETADPGSPTGKLGTPLTQTQGVAFSVTVNAVDEFWNLVATATDTVTITSSDAAAVLPPAAALSGGTWNFSVILNTPPSANLTANAAAPTRTGTSPPVPIDLAGGTFNACDVAATCTNATPSTYVKTKIAGAGFSLDIVALKLDGSQHTNYNATVRVELLDASDNTGALDSDNCRPTWGAIATLVPDPSFVPANSGRITAGPFNVANAYQAVRVRITSQSGASRRGCSTDNFAIRPSAFSAFSVSDDGTPANAGTARTLNDSAFGGVFHKAGRPVSVRANAVNAAAAITSNYAGTPSANLTACAGAACTATFGTLALGTAFAAGQLISDIATYDQVGSFGLQLVDDTFAAVDNADGSTLAERRIQSAVIDVGRFVPDNFAVALNAPSFTTACGAGNFTYVGQTFGYGTQPVITVVARDAASNTTTLYEGVWWRITGASLTGRSYTTAGGTLDTTGAAVPDPVISVTGMGTGTLTFNSGTGFFFNRTTAVPPFDAEVSLAIDVIDADGVAYVANPARFGAATPGNGIAFPAGKEMRFGQLRLASANGSNLLPLMLRIEAQHWLEPAPGKGYFVTNTADSCTVVAAANVGAGNFRGGLLSGDTTPSIPAGALSGGVKSLVMSAPGGTKTGSADVVLNLAPTAGAINPCTAFDPPAPTPTAANLAFLRGQWCGASPDRDPVGRARFGSYRGGEEFIHLKENY